PDLPVAVASPSGVVWLSQDGEIEQLTPREASVRLQADGAIVCHRRSTANRLNVPADHPRLLDALELFAFALPARAAVPTPAGLARALGLPHPHSHSAEAVSLLDAVRICLTILSTLPDQGPHRRAVEGLAWTMSGAGWGWGTSVLAA